MFEIVYHILFLKTMDFLQASFNSFLKTVEKNAIIPLFHTCLKYAIIEKRMRDGMDQARWIWYPGDFELYHSLLLHQRREEGGFSYPCVWTLSTPYARVNFSTRFTAENAGSFRALSNAPGQVQLDGKRFPLDADIPVSVGTHTVEVSLLKSDGLPCLYINSPILVTGNKWKASNATVNQVSAGCTPAYYDPAVTPETFLFSYEKKEPVSCREISGGMLYDFGKELFACLVLENASADNQISVYYGESKEEALDVSETIVYQTVTGQTSYRLKGRAFRYLFCKQTGDDTLNIWADYEFLPLQDIGRFSCDRNQVEKIWQVCAYTFHLNSREFFLDGIKRDRWVWSGDAYQSYMVNNYLYFDPEITKRTILALLGKPPYEQHINTINDYSLYVLLSAYDYYFATGDEGFVQFLFGRLKALYQFVLSRLDEEGLICQREGDWIFIDWSDFDREGPMAAEQILLWQATQAMGKMACLCGEEETPYLQRAEALRETIFHRFWCEEKGGFMDGFVSGKKNITRHANIFALLYDFVDTEQAEQIAKRVLFNSAVPAITTPYFKFFELMALCKMGDLSSAQQMIDSYWGAMLELGATTIWEQYIPEERGAEHYAMYGGKYLRSLCHAWGSGPIYLLGRYCLGVAPTSPGYATFTVEPCLGDYQSISGVVPLPHGEKVTVSYQQGRLSVTATQDGGMLRVAGMEYPLHAGEEMVVNCLLD